MIVYRLNYWDDEYEDRSRLEWFRSKRAAEKRCAELRRMYSERDLEVDKITIPSDKQGLIDWLNRQLETWGYL
jgi:hypothetical protein